MVEKADFGSAPYVPTEKVISDSELNALKVYPEEVNESTDSDAVPTPGYVYVIQESESGNATGYYKVGMTVDPKKRMSDLQTGNVRPLGFTRTVQVTDMRGAEAAAHKALETYSVNLGGGKEWFYANSSQESEFYNAFDKAVAPYKPPS